MIVQLSSFILVSLRQPFRLWEPDMPASPELREPPDWKKIPELIDEYFAERFSFVTSVEEISGQFIGDKRARIVVPKFAPSHHHSEQQRGADEQRNGVADRLDQHLGSTSSEEVADETGASVDQPHPNPVDSHFWYIFGGDRLYPFHPCRISSLVGSFSATSVNIENICKYEVKNIQFFLKHSSQVRNVWEKTTSGSASANYHTTSVLQISTQPVWTWKDEIELGQIL